MNKPRKPWLAVLLTLFTPGLGHLYCGKVRNGIYLFIGSQVINFSSYFLLHDPYGMLLTIILGISYTLYCLIDSYKSAKVSQVGYEMKKYNRWYYYLSIWILASLIIQPIVGAALKSNIVEVYKIPSGAMLNTLLIGDHIICDKLFYKNSGIKRGDVVIFPFPKDPKVNYIKRVVGLGGEKLEIKDKQVYIDGNILSEGYMINEPDKIFSSKASPRDNFGPVEIPKDSVFVMGDNRDNSFDSRFWGCVSKSAIKGKAIYKYWSWNSDVSSVRWERIGEKIE